MATSFVCCYSHGYSSKMLSSCRADDHCMQQILARLCMCKKHFVITAGKSQTFSLTQWHSCIDTINKVSVTAVLSVVGHGLQSSCARQELGLTQIKCTGLVCCAVKSLKEQQLKEHHQGTCKLVSADLCCMTPL